MEICQKKKKKKNYFKNKIVIFYQIFLNPKYWVLGGGDKFLIRNSKNMGSLGDKFLIIKNEIFKWQRNFKGAFGWRINWKRESYWAWHRIPSNMGVPPPYPPDVDGRMRLLLSRPKHEKRIGPIWVLFELFEWETALGHKPCGGRGTPPYKTRGCKAQFSRGHLGRQKLQGKRCFRVKSGILHKKGALLVTI